MKTTLDLPSDLVREIKSLAVLEGRRLKDVAVDLLRRGLKRGAEGRTPITQVPRIDIQASGFPVVRCAADAPASKMSIDEIMALEQGALTQEDRGRLGISI